MNFDEYEYKLIKVLSRAIEEHIGNLGSLNVRNYMVVIEKVIRAHPKPSLSSIKPSLLFSGKEFEFNVDGTVTLSEKMADGSKGREIEFWIRPAKAKFDSESDTFVITDITGFLPLDFHRL